MFRVAPYQRKEDPKYDKLKEFIVHYNHADTFLPEACVYGVVYSAAQRFARHASWASEWQVNYPSPGAIPVGGGSPSARAAAVPEAAQSQARHLA